METVSLPPAALAAPDLAANPTLAAIAAGGEGPLGWGAAGNAVWLVQRALMRASVLRPRAEPCLGPRTARAIACFQRERGLPVTGAVDRETLLALDRAAAPGRRGL